MKTKSSVLIAILIFSFNVFSQWSNAQVPANDNCSGAVIMNVSATCNPVTGSTYFATSSLPQDVCAGEASFPVRDVWYKFTVAGGLSLTIKAKPISGVLVLALFSNSCNNLSYVACANSMGTGVAQLNIGVLPAGTYFYRVYSMGTAPVKFSTCVTGVVPLQPQEEKSDSSLYKQDNGFVAGSVSVRPNPSHGVFTVSFQSELAGHYQLKVANDIGNVVFATQGTSNAGWNTLDIDVSSSGPGLYWIAVKGTGINAFTKALVQ